MRTSLKKDPPAPCPGCGEQPPPVDLVDHEHFDDGAITATAKCAECGEVLEDDHLLQEPDHV